MPSISSQFSLCHIYIYTYITNSPYLSLQQMVTSIVAHAVFSYSYYLGQFSLHVPCDPNTALPPASTSVGQMYPSPDPDGSICHVSKGPMPIYVKGKMQGSPSAGPAMVIHTSSTIKGFPYSSSSQKLLHICIDKWALLEIIDLCRSKMKITYKDLVRKY